MAEVMTMQADQGFSTSVGFGSIMKNQKAEIEKIRGYEKEKIKTAFRFVVFGVIIFGSLFAIGLIAAQVIKGIFALLVAGGFVVGAFYAYRYLRNMDPAIAQWLKNKRVKVMIAEAKSNAVEQLTNQVIANEERLSFAREARNKVGGLVLRLKKELEETDINSEWYQRKKELAETVERAYEKVRVNIDRAAEANKKFDLKVKEYKKMDEFATIAQVAMQMLNRTGADALEDALSLAAFEAIDGEFNTALVDIENTARDLDIDESV